MSTIERTVESNNKILKETLIRNSAVRFSKNTAAQIQIVHGQKVTKGLRVDCSHGDRQKMVPSFYLVPRLVARPVVRIDIDVLLLDQIFENFVQAKADGNGRVVERHVGENAQCKHRRSGDIVAEIAIHHHVSQLFHHGVGAPIPPIGVDRHPGPVVIAALDPVAVFVGVDRVGNESVLKVAVVVFQIGLPDGPRGRGSSGKADVHHLGVGDGRKGGYAGNDLGTEMDVCSRRILWLLILATLVVVRLPGDLALAAIDFLHSCSSTSGFDLDGSGPGLFGLG
mmetsp:Transcript_18932/g.54560  ORF Transcript_18932/g.54560 Transcript_18932/m.54560 type:complete len:282 (+) Transcript_18932:415-1260(+)